MPAHEDPGGIRAKVVYGDDGTVVVYELIRDTTYYEIEKLTKGRNTCESVFSTPTSPSYTYAMSIRR